MKGGLSVITKPVADLTESDLAELIQRNVPEIASLEYKATLEIGDADLKKEFLADVSSFANATGGIILFGVACDSRTRLPSELVGLEVANTDALALSIQNLIRDGLRPRIAPPDLKFIQLASGRFVMALGVKQSWSRPHRIEFRDFHRFYARNSNGKYLLDVGELRSLFLLSETFAIRTRQFREDRLAALLSAAPTIVSGPRAKVVMHLIPFTAFVPGQRYDISPVAQNLAAMPPLGASGFSSRHTLEGFMTFHAGQDAQIYSYTHLYRSGILEAVDALTIPFGRGKGEEKFIPSGSIESDLIEAFPRYISNLESIGVSPPLVFMLSLVGVRGFQVYVSPQRHVRRVFPIPEDVLAIPEQIIVDWKQAPEVLLRPSFDAIWNACGLSQSFNFDRTGKWTGQN